LRAHYDTEAPFTDKEVSDLLIALGTGLRKIHAAELDAIGELAVTFPG
jgi:hypothetical protein